MIKNGNVVELEPYASLDRKRKKIKEGAKAFFKTLFLFTFTGALLLLFSALFTLWTHSH